MDCKEARPLLDAYVDRELAARDAREVQQHIDGCAACRHESDALRALGGAIRTAPYHRAPDALRERILAALPAIDLQPPPQTYADQLAAQLAAQSSDQERREAGRRRPARTRWFDRWFPPGGTGWGWAGGAASGQSASLASGGALALTIALCAALAAGIALTVRGPGEPGSFVDELVASHVRAELSGRDIDVVSSDQHTVKPWFNGRIDYAPPVEDLAASGFPLAGGRLDYVGHRRVAVLTYRHRKHVIDVYVFPDNDPAAGKPGPSIVRDGYAVARWRDAGMMWWAVTDAAPDSLTALESALRARLQGGGAGTE
jgi:anti-sigma factor (TIGR02949 family)